MAQLSEPVVEPGELNSTIWSKTPHDIINLIIKEANKATLVSWSRTGSAFYDVSSALLWEDIYIDGPDLQTYWEWNRTQAPPSNPRPENGGSIDFLIRGPAHRDFHQMLETLHGDTATSPRTRIRHLRLYTAPFRPRQTADITNQELETVLGFFALFMTRLDSLYILGDLSQGTLGQIIKFKSLRHLNLGRLELHARHLERTTNTHTSGLISAPWAKLALDFTCLSNMQSLTSLRISEFMPLEALGLAKAIQNLQHLTMLSLSACYLTTATDHTNWLTQSLCGVSLLVPFLEALSSREDKANDRAGNGVPGGFPRRLQTLVLKDHFHSHLPCLNWILQSATKPCENLRNVTITFTDHTITQNFLCSVGLPMQPDGKIASWNILCSAAGLKYCGGAAWKQACIIRCTNASKSTVEITRVSEVDFDEAA